VKVPIDVSPCRQTSFTKEKKEWEIIIEAKPQEEGGCEDKAVQSPPYQDKDSLD
jgi:hypothetical protein